jgi:hypothetical protein
MLNLMPVMITPPPLYYASLMELFGLIRSFGCERKKHLPSPLSLSSVNELLVQDADVPPIVLVLNRYACMHNNVLLPTAHFPPLVVGSHKLL